jgi:enamine deaminase RidA (YjgF/YER057c/UK114 family)
MADKKDAEESTVESTETNDAPVSNMSMVLITAFGLAILIVIVMLASEDSSVPSPDAIVVENEVVEMPGAEASAGTAPTAAAPSVTPAAATPRAVTSGDVNVNGIERKGEGRHFYTTIKIPANAETLYLSGSGARAQEDGSWGDMEQQTVDTFSRFKETLEAEGWSMGDIVQVRAFAVAGEYGLLDFDGFNRGYRQFFGTEENPMKPVRSFVQIEGLVVPGWLVEIEIRAARVPQ